MTISEDTAPEAALSDTARRAAMDVLLTRSSNNMLQDPVPTDEELDQIFDAALRAPDHMNLHPWRFVVIRGGEPLQNFVKLLQDATRARDPEMPEGQIKSLERKVGGAPMIIAVGTRIAEAKIPEIEQVLSAGAAATNMLNAIHALGYAGKWVTGGNVYDPTVNEALGFKAPDQMIGLIYVGTEKMKLPEKERARREDHVVEWTGPAAG